MPDDRRAILRKMQDQRKESLSVASEEYERQQRQHAFDAKASLVSLRQFNASDFQEEDYENQRYPDGTNRTDTLKLILYDLNSAIAPREIRLLAIRSAMDEFDHDEELLHDEELDLRADHILLQKLCYAMAIDPRDEEVGYICAAMEMVYRAGKKRLAKSFHEICDVLLPMFVEMIKRPPHVERIEDVAEEEKEIVVSEEEEEEDEQEYGIEPNLEFDPYAPNAHLAEEDDESAESVSIPAGTGEYFDHMAKMANMESNSGSAAEVVATKASKDLMLHPVNLSGGGEVEPYNHANAPPPQQQQQPPHPEGQKYTPEQLYALAEQISKMQAQQASQQQMTSGMPGAQPTSYTEAAAGQLVPVHPNNAVSHYVPYIGQQIVPISQGQTVTAAQPYQVGAPIHQATHPPNFNQPIQTDQGVTAQPYQVASHPPQGMVPIQPGQSMATQPYSMPHALPSNHFSMVASDAGQMAYPPTQMHPSEVGQATPVTYPPSHEVVSTARQLTNLSVGDASPTDDEALRLRGGGEGDSEGDNDSQGVTAKFDELYEGANKNLYMGETEVEKDSFLDSSDITGDSEPMRKLDDRLRASSKSSGSNAMFEGAFNDIQQNAPGFDSRGNFNTGYSEYVNDDGGQFNHPAAGHGYKSNDNMENDNSLFTNQHDFGADDESNPFVERSPRAGELDTNKRSQGSALRAQHPSANITTTLHKSDIPTHIGDDQASISASLRSGLTNDFTYDTGSRKIDRKSGTQDFNGMESNPFDQGDVPSHVDNLNAVKEHPNEDHDLGEYEAGHYQHSQDWAETSESSQSRGVYTVPTFNPENERYARRDSELTSDSHYDESRYDEKSRRGSSTLHVVEEENDDHQEEINYSDQHQDMAHGDYGVGNYDDDIFHFQEPSMAKRSAESFATRYVAKEVFCPLAIRKVLKILRYFSRVLSAMEQLAQQPGLVDALLYQMTRNPHTSDDEDEIAARIDAIACVVNLACAEENKIMLVYHPGLLNAVIDIANHDPIEEAREHAAIVLMNLAYAEENKVHMVNQDNLLDTLVCLLSDVSPFTRRYASAALFTLACTYANTAVMARHCDGGILEALRKVLLNDPVDDARVNAAEALFNMARNNSDDTVENMGNHPKLLASLAHSVLTDYSADVRAYSARALEWLSADIHYPMHCHPRLLQALTTASQWTKTTCIAEALKMQASLSENRRSMVEHPGLLDALAQLSLLEGINDDEVKTCAISALERLSKEPSTRHLMARNEGVMTALTRATFADDGYDDDEEDSPKATLMKVALKNLAEHL